MATDMKWSPDLRHSMNPTCHVVSTRFAQSHEVVQTGLGDVLKVSADPGAVVHDVGVPVKLKTREYPLAWYSGYGFPFGNEPHIVRDELRPGLALRRRDQELPTFNMQTGRSRPLRNVHGT